MVADVLNAIGNTPLVQLHRVLPPGAARVFVKLEFANPTGSMKDRMARAAIEAAEADGRLQPGGTVVEYTGGTTGVSLAFVCAAKGYKFHAVFSDAFSDEKRAVMEAYGGKVTVVPSGDKQITEKVIKTMIAEAHKLSLRPGHWWCDQINNRDAVRGYYALGEEILGQTNGTVDAFVQSVGSAHCLLGVARILRESKKDMRIIAVEPAESAVLSGGSPGGHRIEGIGIGFLPPLWEPNAVDEIMAVSTAEATVMARRLAREEGLFAGTSSGANVVGALRLAQRLGKDATVVTILVDSGLRYMSTDLYRPA